MKSVNELLPHGMPTGAIPITFDVLARQWKRTEGGPICPLSVLILAQQPDAASWLRAASLVTGWSAQRVFAFKSRLQGRMDIITKRPPESDEATKGLLDAALYISKYKSKKITREQTWEK